MRTCGFCGIVLLVGNVFFTCASSAQDIKSRGFKSKSAQKEKANAELVAEVTSIVGEKLEGFLELRSSKNGFPLIMPIRNGRAYNYIPSGDYSVSTHVYANKVPIVVDIRPLTVTADRLNTLSLSILEGATGERSLLSFDQDRDQVLDKVEVEQETDPLNAASVPNTKVYEWDNQLKSNEAGWIRGDLQTHSSHGIGKESVKKLIQRAEKSGIDFLSITDRNTMGSINDPDYKSDSLILVPGMEWGNEEKGIALLYGPRTFHRVPNTNEEAQYKMARVQAEGGVFSIGHPCFPITSWNWPIHSPNAVQVWCMDWREIPPMQLAQVAEEFKAYSTIIDNRNNREIIKWKHAMARAANNQSLSSNGQSVLYYDLELNQGLRAAAIGGSNSGNPGRPIGAPITYVFVRERSVSGILEGLRNGWTYVSKNIDGPTINWYGDIFADGQADITIGGTIPLDETTRFLVHVKKAKGKRFEILLNGLPIRSLNIPSDDWKHTFSQTPSAYAVYRICILDQVGEDTEPGFGYRDMSLLTSPIYAQGVISDTSNTNNDGWVSIENEWTDPKFLVEHMRELVNQQR